MDQQYEQLSGKTILVIRSCGFTRQPVFERLKKLKVKIVLVDTEEDEYAAKYIHSFVKYPIRGCSIADEENDGKEIIELLGDRLKQLSACFTFFDEHLYLTSLLCQKLELTGMTPNAVQCVKSRHRVNEILRSDNETAGYSPLSFRIDTVDDIIEATGLTYPAVLKPEFGCYSNGVTEVLSQDDCVEKYKELQVMSETEQAGFGCRYGRSMVLMEFLPGNSYPVEVILFDGELLKGIPSTMGPKFRDLMGLPKAFSDTATCSTSCLTRVEENELITAGYKICKNIGLNNGVFNVELKLTESGFQLIEVNSRPGSHRRCAVFRDTHGIDIFLIHTLISCGIKPIFPEMPRKFAVGCYLYSFHHRLPLSTPWIIERIETLCETRQILFIKEFEDMKHEDYAFPRPYVHLVALGESIDTAKAKLIEVFDEFQLSTDAINIEELTKSFVNNE